jgi:hypothetical protein
MSAVIGRFQHTGGMRQAFAYEVTLVMEPEADERAPGAAVAAALCGHWDHKPPCPLSPHRVRVNWVSDELYVRVLFATEPETEGGTHYLRQTGGGTAFTDRYRRGPV